MTTDLITRLQEAECGSRELDAEIAKAVGIIVSQNVTPVHDYSIPQPCTWSNGSRWRQMPKYSTSLDAALALTAEKHQLVMGILMSAMMDANRAASTPQEVVAILPRHVVIALLSALKAQGEDHG